MKETRIIRVEDVKLDPIDHTVTIFLETSDGRIAMKMPREAAHAILANLEKVYSTRH
ncbi:hypothetical protein [Taklimakanibacter deserti]|uniref:hypothetical protein n=1 Tax=Taklimakanibacter deserti TaxID=2267839 RepID=UPI0013C49CFB